MDGLDRLVTSHLADRLLGPNRLAGLLASLAEKRASSNAEVQGRASILQGEIAQTDDKLRRFHKIVEDGVTDLDDVFGDRLAALKSDRERAKAALERTKIQSAPNITFESDQIERFGAFMRERITTGETTFRKAYLRSIVDAIEVDDKAIRIHGSKASLEQTVIAGERDYDVLDLNRSASRLLQCKKRLDVVGERRTFSRSQGCRRRWSRRRSTGLAHMFLVE